MKFQRLEVEQFGTLGTPVEVEFGEGLNVLHGPNEAGKSTLLRAVWIALTWDPTTSSNDITAMYPHSGGNPEIVLEFEHDGADLTLEKRFVPQSGKARMTVEEQGRVETFEDDAVEQELRRRLGFGQAASRNSYPSHHGLWPLLWVRQWESRHNPANVDRFDDAGRSTLSETLARETGEVLGGDAGHAILRAAEEAFDDYWTPTGSKTSKSDAAIVEAQADLDEARQRLTDLENKRETYETLIDQYQRYAEEAEELEATLPQWERRRDEARREVERIDELETDLEQKETARQAADNRAETVRERGARRDELKHDIASTESAIDDKEAALDQQREELEAVDAEIAELEEAVEEAKSRRDAAAADRQRADAAREYMRADRRAAELREKLDRVDEHREELSALEKERQRLDVDESTADELGDLKDEWQDVASALKAASARVEIAAEAEVDLRIGDEERTLSDGDSTATHIDRATDFAIGDLARLTVEPGGRDLGELRGDVERKRDAFETALEEAGVASVREARDQARRRRELAGKIANVRTLVDQLAPDGRDALVDALEQATNARDNAREALMAEIDGDLEEALPASEQEARDRIREARDVLGTRKDELEDARADLEATRQRRNRVSEEVARAAQQLESQRDRLDGEGGLRDQLDAHIDDYGTDEELEEAVEEADDEVESAREEVEAIADQLEELEPEETRREAERLEEVYEERHRELEELKQKRRDTRIKIEAGDVEGLHDRIAEVEAEIDEHRDRLRRLQRKANTAKLLYRTLESSRRELRQTFLKPLRKRATRLVRRLFPDARIEFDGGFRVQGLIRDRTATDDFSALSAGTSEQVGILVRLSLAQLVNEEQTYPLVLDDPFVATDDRRFDALLPILVEAAEDLQIVVTTCHWDRYRALDSRDVAVHDLVELKRDEVDW